jgi:hypothetical protein
MIINEKQIMILIDICYKFAIFLHDIENHIAANGIEEMIEKIMLQQSKELKKID